MQKALRLCLYTDADHASGVHDVKSTSVYVGECILTLEGPNSFWPLCWGSKRQGATARSTCEAEMISLDSGVFERGIANARIIGGLRTVLDRPIDLICQQDNASVIQIVHGGYSPKLRHMKKGPQTESVITVRSFRRPTRQTAVHQNRLATCRPVYKGVRAMQVEHGPRIDAHQTTMSFLL